MPDLFRFRNRSLNAVDDLLRHPVYLVPSYLNCSYLFLAFHCTTIGTPEYSTYSFTKRKFAEYIRESINCGETES